MTARLAKVPRIPTDVDDATVRIGERDVRLTNLGKTYFPAAGFAKRDLLQFYADVSPLLLPHVRDRAMVMKRYPNGAEGDFFFMKRTPPGAPPWLRTCEIAHGPDKTIAFPIVDDAAALLWTVNLGCIDLNPWYARCDDTGRPDFLHFDLDPVKDRATGPTPFATVRQAALLVRGALEEVGMPAYAKTSGSNGIHVYVPIARGPEQHDVWRFAKALATALAARHPDVLTAEYTIVKRPAGRVLVDYNQNAWGRTLASIYSVRPTAQASVSTPVSWDEIRAGIEITDFRLDNVRDRFSKVGDLWKPLLAKTRRVDLARYL
jgi:bifunctional non-homologous end joining protein LigD